MLLTQDDPVVAQRITANLPHNFVDIVSLDDGGAPVTPGGGNYEIYVKTTKEGGFKALTDNGTIPAANTGGDTLADGVAIGASFLGNPLVIKVVPVGVTGAVSYKVHVIQNAT